VPDVLFNAAMRNTYRGRIAFETDTFYAMLVGTGYTPDQDAHEFRSSVTSEIAGVGYDAGGKPCPVTVAATDNANDRFDVTFGPVEWAGATISGIAQVVIYKRRGGAAAADELVLCEDADTVINIVSGTLTMEPITIRVQMP
jgi:hypothetical protein